jgi:anti-sigma regulatory factor (Ser/Thr protein kinase)
VLIVHRPGRFGTLLAEAPLLTPAAWRSTVGRRMPGGTSVTSSAADANGGRRPEVVRRTWPAAADQLGAIRTEMQRWFATLGFDGDDEQDLVLVVSEAVSNVVEHAYTGRPAGGTIELRCWTEAGDLCVEVADHGTWREPPPGNPGRGFGLPMMQRLAAALVVRHDTHGTRVLLRHPLPDRPPAPARYPARHLAPLDD